MLFDILKIVIPVFAGIAVNEWYRKRNSRVQKIPLVERVNRAVSPQLKDIALARVTQDSDGNRQLEEIHAVREYQFTLRNTSSIHLKDLEILFEFPAEDVEGWAERPVLSKTAPVEVKAITTEPWKKGFRWQIPNLPSTDSIEFGFKAINPYSDKYEASLYNSGSVILKKSTEDSVVGQGALVEKALPLGGVVGCSLIAAYALIMTFIFPSYENKSSILSQGGCTLMTTSSYYPIESSFWLPSHGPWYVYNEIKNLGKQNCIVRAEQLSSKPETITPGNRLNQGGYSMVKPRLLRRDISLGAENAVHNVQVAIFSEQNQ